MHFALPTTAEYNTTYNFNFIAYIFLFNKTSYQYIFDFVHVYVTVSTFIFPVIWFVFLVRCLISIPHICGQLQLDVRINVSCERHATYVGSNK